MTHISLFSHRPNITWCDLSKHPAGKIDFSMFHINGQKGNLWYFDCQCKVMVITGTHIRSKMLWKIFVGARMEKLFIDCIKISFLTKNTQSQFPLSSSFGSFNCIMSFAKLYLYRNQGIKTNILVSRYSCYEIKSIMRQKPFQGQHVSYYICHYYNFQQWAEQKCVVSGWWAVFPRIWWGSPGNWPHGDRAPRVKYFS